MSYIPDVVIVGVIKTDSEGNFRIVPCIQVEDISLSWTNSQKKEWVESVVNMVNDLCKELNCSESAYEEDEGFYAVWELWNRV